MTEIDFDKVVGGLSSCTIENDGVPDICHRTDCPYKDSSPFCAHELARDARILVHALWTDLNDIRSCSNCKNRDKCDPDDDGEKQRFWEKCGGSLKLKWEWRGVNHDGHE